MADTPDLFGDILNLLEECTKTRFVEPQPEQAIHFKTLTKQLYKLSTKLQKTPIVNSKALPKLLVSGFDEEQIWQQMELKNIPSLKHYEKEVKVLNPESLASSIPTEIKSNDALPPMNESDFDDEDGYAFDDDTGDESDVPLDALKPQKSLARPKTSFQKKKNWESEADDQFFKQSELEAFLKQAELEAEQVNNQTHKESEEIDYFAEVDSLDEDEVSDDEISNKKADEVSDKDDVENAKGDLFSKPIKSSRDLMYEDFFDPPTYADEEFEQNMDDDGEEQQMDDDDLSHDENEHPESSKDYDTRDYDPTEDMEVDPKPKNLFEDDDDNTQKYSDKSKSPFDVQQEKNRKRIKEMEANLLKPKPWQLTGEIAASNRPENSLMHQPTTFDVNPRQNAIDSTVDLTSRVEDIIKMAISNKAWADVERKVKPKEDLTYKRRVELDQTKSKKSLADIYEEDFLKLKHKADEEEKEDAKHIEIRKLMDTLTPELYALFSHIPKPPVPEIRVINNLPAISVEEIAPVGLSNAQLLAPEEVKRKPKGDLKSDAEKSVTDKKRERRKKKLRQKFEQKKTDEKMRELAVSNPALAKKHEKLTAIKKLKQHKNTIIVNTDHSKKIKSSKDFFSRLEETVHGKKHVKSK